MVFEKTYFEDETIELSQYSSYESMEFINCKFISNSAIEISFRNSKFMECLFEKCNLSNSIFIGARLRDVKFIGCKVLGINWSQTGAFFDISFSESLMDLCVFQDLDLRSFQAINSSLCEADFSGCNLENAYLTGSSFRSATFNNCNLESADLRDAKDYFIDPMFNKVKKAKFSMPDAMSFFEALDITIE